MIIKVDVFPGALHGYCLVNMKCTSLHGLNKVL